jgi:hypothetical protein
LRAGQTIERYWRTVIHRLSAIGPTLVFDST